MRHKNVYIIAGPNGSGKTTLAGRSYANLFSQLKAKGYALERPVVIAKNQSGQREIIDKESFRTIQELAR